jgi:hypothetical protein
MACFALHQFPVAASVFCVAVLLERFLEPRQLAQPIDLFDLRQHATRLARFSSRRLDCTSPLDELPELCAVSSA